MTLTSGASAAGLARGHDAVALRHLAGRYPSEPAGWQAVGLTVEPKVLQALARARFQRHCPYLPSPRSAPSAMGTCQGVLAVGPLELYSSPVRHRRGHRLLHQDVLPGIEAGPAGGLGFGRIVASEIEAPNMLVILV